MFDADFLPANFIHRRGGSTAKSAQELNLALQEVSWQKSCWKNGKVFLAKKFCCFGVSLCILSYKPLFTQHLMVQTFFGRVWSWLELHSVCTFVPSGDINYKLILLNLLKLKVCWWKLWGLPAVWSVLATITIQFLLGVGREVYHSISL